MIVASHKNHKKFLKVWTQLTSDPEILDYVAHCHIEFTDDPAKYFCGAIGTLKEAIKLLELGVIINSNHEHSVFPPYLSFHNQMVCVH